MIILSFPYFWNGEGQVINKEKKNTFTLNIATLKFNS